MHHMYNLEKDKDKYYILGRVVKTYGYRGEIMIQLDVEQAEDYADLKVFFINMEQSLVPWFPEYIEIQKDRAQVKIADIENPEDAKQFLGREVYLPLNKLKKAEKSKQQFLEMIGYKAIDEEYGEIGIVEDILDRPEQKIIRILKAEKEILIPLMDEMISKIDKSKKVVLLKTPPGLIELYL